MLNFSASNKEASVIAHEQAQGMLDLLNRVYLSQLRLLGFDAQEFFVRIGFFSASEVRIEFSELIVLMLKEYQEKSSDSTYYPIVVEENCLVLRENFFEAFSTLQYVLALLILENKPIDER